LLRMAADARLDGNHRILFQHVDELGLEGRSYDQVAYHLRLLIEAKYLLGSAQVSAMPIVSRLTWEGHEFLDNIRDAGVWHSTKERLKGLPSLGLAVVAEIAKAEIKKRLGLS
jgi:hypothetical protein